jgi:hypothetical protein
MRSREDFSAGNSSRLPTVSSPADEPLGADRSQT